MQLDDGPLFPAETAFEARPQLLVGDAEQVHDMTYRCMGGRPSEAVELTKRIAQGKLPDAIEPVDALTDTFRQNHDRPFAIRVAAKRIVLYQAAKFVESSKPLAVVGGSGEVNFQLPSVAHN